jgi:hypothetical protein
VSADVAAEPARGSAVSRVTFESLGNGACTRVVKSRELEWCGGRRHEESTRTRFAQLLGEGFAAARRPGLRVLLVVTVATGFASEAVDRLGVARLDEIGLPEGIDPALLIGGASVVESLGAIALLFVYGRRLAGPQLVTAMTTLNALTAIGVGLMARSGLLAIALAGMMAEGTTRSVARTATVGWTNHFTNRSNRATVHSFVGQAQSVGEISGGVALGIVAQQVGIGEALTVSAVIYMLASGWSSRGHARWTTPQSA